MEKWIIIWYWLVPPANLEYYVQMLIDIPSVIYRVEQRDHTSYEVGFQIYHAWPGSGTIVDTFLQSCQQSFAPCCTCLEKCAGVVEKYWFSHGQFHCRL